MHKILTRARTLLLCSLPSLASAATLAPPPPFPAGATIDTIQGVAVKDPYRALEDSDAPAVKAWGDAENARTRAYLDALPGRAAIAAKLSRLIKATSPSIFGSKRAASGSSRCIPIRPGSRRRW